MQKSVKAQISHTTSKVKGSVSASPCLTCQNKVCLLCVYDVLLRLYALYVQVLKKKNLALLKCVDGSRNINYIQKLGFGHVCQICHHDQLIASVMPPPPLPKMMLSFSLGIPCFLKLQMCKMSQFMQRLVGAYSKSCSVSEFQMSRYSLEAVISLPLWAHRRGHGTSFLLCCAGPKLFGKLLTSLLLLLQRLKINLLDR